MEVTSEKTGHTEKWDSGFSPGDTEGMFREYARTRDIRLRGHLVMAHQNLVRYLAGKFSGRGVPVEDLIQVGMIGLINAVDRFEPDRGIQFSTYATPTIVGEIRRYFRDKTWSVKVPRRLQELNMAVSKAAEEITQQIGRSPRVDEIAKRLGASEEETLEAMELGNAYDTVSFDTPMSSEAGSESGPVSLAEFLGEQDHSIENMERFGDLRQAMDDLEPRERAIIYGRFFLEMSQSEIAKRLNISQMHVSRLQQRALTRLKELLSQ